MRFYIIKGGVFMKRLYSQNVWLFSVVIVFILLEIACEIGTAVLFGTIIDVTKQQDNSKLVTITYIAIGFILLNTMIFYISKIFQRKYIIGQVNNLRESIFSKYLKQNNKQFYSEDIGSKISLLTNDMNIVEVDYFQSFILIIKSALLFIGAVVTITYTSYQIAIFLLCSSLLALFLPKLIGKKLEKHKIKLSDAQANYTARISEYLNGFSTITTFNIEKIISKKFTNSMQDIKSTALVFEKNYRFIQAISLILGAISFLGCMVFGVFLVNKYVLTLGALITCIQMANHITNPVYTLVDRISSFKSVKKILEKIDTLEVCEEERANFEQICNFDNFSINDVVLNYGDKRVLDNINYKFEKNKKYALVGLSGSGKSTILKLLFGIISSDRGFIGINDKKLQDVEDSNFLDIVSYIDQNVFIFKGSIYDNITLYSKKYKEEDVYKLITILGLEKFADKLMDEDFIAENGSNMSLGEKQRIAIARSLIRQPEVILADEILASLDNENAKNIESYLLANKNLTLVSVTHRLIPEILKEYDEILVLKDGRIEEADTFDNLIKRDTYFKKLYNFESFNNN